MWFFWSEIYIRFLPQKIFAASRRFFTIISRFYNQIPYKKAPQAKIFRYQTSNIMIFFVKLTEKSPKSNINPQNIYTIFEPGRKSRRYIFWYACLLKMICYFMVLCVTLIEHNFCVKKSFSIIFDVLRSSRSQLYNGSSLSF